MNDHLDPGASRALFISALTFRAPWEWGALRSFFAILILLGAALFAGRASAQTAPPLASFGTPGQLDSGSTFPIRTVASIAVFDPTDTANDVLAPIDFDGDGNPDIVQADGGTANEITVWLQQTTGPYAKVQFGVSAAPAGSITDLAVADVNHDGLPDIIVAAGGSIYVYTNDGVIVHQGETAARLSFTLAATLTAQDALGTAESFARIAVADLDGDGLPEIVASSTTINATTMASEGHVSVFEHAAGNNATYNPAVV